MYHYCSINLWMRFKPSVLLFSNEMGSFNSVRNLCLNITFKHLLGGETMVYVEILKLNLLGTGVSTYDRVII
jgi:hypothetical protein